MKELGRDSKKYSLPFLDEMRAKGGALKGGKGAVHSVVSHNKKKEKHGDDAGKTKVRTPI
jgi:hypothetical protein